MLKILAIDTLSNCGQFIVGSLFYKVVKKYISLRPPNTTQDRFFIHYRNGKCTSQPIGIHTIGDIPSKIATFLKLTDVDKFTGHCFRRSSVTLLSDTEDSMQMII